MAHRLGRLSETLEKRFQTACEFKHKQAITQALKFDQSEEGRQSKSAKAEAGLCSWSEIFSNGFGIDGFPWPHVLFKLEHQQWESPVLHPLDRICRGNIGVEPHEFAWRFRCEDNEHEDEDRDKEGDSSGDKEGAVVQEQEQEELEAKEVLFIQRVTTEWIRFSPVAVDGE